MKKVIVFAVMLALISTYVLYGKAQKKKVLVNLATHFKKLCVTNNKCVTQPDGWVQFDVNSFYDKTSSNAISYEVTNNQMSFILKWKIANGSVLMARAGVIENVEVESTFY